MGRPNDLTDPSPLGGTVTHTGAIWTNEKSDRVAIFNCYNTLGSKWHNWHPDPDHLQSMPPKRQSLFRPVHCQNNRVDA